MCYHQLKSVQIESGRFLMRFQKLRFPLAFSATVFSLNQTKKLKYFNFNLFPLSPLSAKSGKREKIALTAFSLNQWWTNYVHGPNPARYAFHVNAVTNQSENFYLFLIFTFKNRVTNQIEYLFCFWVSLRRELTLKMLVRSSIKIKF